MQFVMSVSNFAYWGDAASRGGISCFGHCEVFAVLPRMISSCVVCGNCLSLSYFLPLVMLCSERLFCICFILHVDECVAHHFTTFLYRHCTHLRQAFLHQCNIQAQIFGSFKVIYSFNTYYCIAEDNFP